MTSFQISLFQLDNYGPWTTTPHPQPEPVLQALQSRLYADLVEAIGEYDGYTFFGRFDNIIALTHGMDRTAHRAIQQRIADSYPVTVSVGIGTGQSPTAALTDATQQLQSTGSAQDPDRTAELVGNPLDSPGEMQIAHFDIVDVTSTMTDQMDAHGAMLQVGTAALSLSSFLYQQKDALAYFVGGDNVIAICPPSLSRQDYQDALDHVLKQHDIPFQVGVGMGTQATDAGMDAKHALEQCRDNGTQIEGLQVVSADD